MNPECSENGHSDMVSVAFSPDGTRIVSGSRDTLVKIWDAAAGAEVISFEGVYRVVLGDQIVFSGSCIFWLGKVLRPARTRFARQLRVFLLNCGRVGRCAPSQVTQAR